MVAIIGGAVAGLGSVVGSSISAGAQSQAAQTEANATAQAQQAEQTQFQTGLDFTRPFAQGGANAFDELLAELGQGPAVGQPISGGGPSYGYAGELGAYPSLTDPTQLPGYSFTLDQGLKAVNNAASATGTAAVGMAPGSTPSTNYSGAQAKGDINYATGLASSSYSQYLQNYWANQNNRFNMLIGLANQGLGASTSIQGNAVTAGGQIGTTGISGTTAANNFNVGGANTQAAGITGASSSLGSSLLLANALGANQGSTLSSGTLIPGTTTPTGNSFSIGQF